MLRIDEKLLPSAAEGWVAEHLEGLLTPQWPGLGGWINPLLAAQLLRNRHHLMLFQNANSLFFAETDSLHRLSPQLENRLSLNARLFKRAGH